MRTVRSVADVRAAVAERRAEGDSVGFVPTMGAFHEGHLSLMRRTFHEHPNAPFRLLSRQLQAVSLAADELSLVELKASMLYLQMTLYGAVERCMVGTFDPRIVVSDRHAVVDTLAYGPLYRGLIGATLDGDRLAPVLRERLAPGAPLALDWALSYHARVSRRLGSASDFWELPHEVAAIFEREPAEVTAEFVRRYESSPPDAVVVLAIDPAEALARSSRRAAASSEMHENAVALTKLAALYDHALERLAAGLPGLAVHRIDVTGLSQDEALDGLLARLPPAAQPAAARLTVSRRSMGSRRPGRCARPRCRSAA